MLPDQESRPAPDTFDAHVLIEEGQPVVVARGEIDLASATRLDSALAQALSAGPRITLDLGDVTFMDSTGINAVVGVLHHLGRTPEAIVLRDPTDAVRRVLAIAGIDHLFTVHTTRPSLH
jgi:anti-anti-sigma factor